MTYLIFNLKHLMEVLTEVKRKMHEQNEYFNIQKIFKKYEKEIIKLKSTIIEPKNSLRGSIAEQTKQKKESVNFKKAHNNSVSKGDKEMTKVKKGQEICGTPSIDHCVNYRIPEEGEERERTTKFIQRNTV